uniref:Uncharacterized protein n=1 Tax=Oryza meridionalis TaxID=40149 RepID=A0A0E0C2W0_9ORYZ
MTLNRRLVLRVDDIDACGCRFLLGGENQVPFGTGVDSILDVVPLLKASLRRFSAPLEDTSCIMLSKLLAFGKLGNDDFCEVFAGFPFN